MQSFPQILQSVLSQKIDVEVSNREQAEEAILAGADIVMLDNMDPAQFCADAAALKNVYHHVLIEGSGGLTNTNIQQYMSPDVDILSTSWLHQGVPHIDFSLKVAHA